MFFFSRKVLFARNFPYKMSQNFFISWASLTFQRDSRAIEVWISEVNLGLLELMESRDGVAGSDNIAIFYYRIKTQHISVT
jgi:hypothetical protein